jgi:hypothetical protein
MDGTTIAVLLVVVGLGGIAIWLAMDQTPSNAPMTTAPAPCNVSYSKASISCAAIEKAGKFVASDLKTAVISIPALPKSLFNTQKCSLFAQATGTQSCGITVKAKT